MDILIDTNFLINCIKEKIDFERITKELIDEEIKWIIPRQVEEELTKIIENKDKKAKDRKSARLALEKIKEINTEKIDLEKNQNIDESIRRYLKKNNITLATLDKGLKKSLPKTKILTLKGKRYLQII